MLLLLLFSCHEKRVRRKLPKWAAGCHPLLNSGSFRFIFFKKKRSQGTKEMKRGTCFFDTCSFIALDVGAVEPCLINPGIWEVYQTLRGIKTSLMLSATVCSSCHFPRGSHGLPGALTGQKKRFLHSSPGSSLSLSFLILPCF